MGSGAERDLLEVTITPCAGQTIHPSSPRIHGGYIKRHWDKPFSHRVPVRGFARLDIQDMGELGLADEEQRFHHLGKWNGFQPLFQKKYKFSALAISALNVNFTPQSKRRYPDYRGHRPPITSASSHCDVTVPASSE